MASLDAYQKLEIEKKKLKLNKNVFNGPIIRYHSVTMPILDEEEEDDEEGENDKEEDKMVKSLSKEQQRKKSRNFIIFTSEQTIKEIFTSKEQTKPKPKKCAITGLPAKYFDPLTKMPYANLFAFKKLREAYANKKIPNTNNSEH